MQRLCRGETNQSLRCNGLTSDSGRMAMWWGWLNWLWLIMMTMIIVNINMRALSQTTPTWVNGRTVIPLESYNFPKCYRIIIYFYLWYRIISVESQKCWLCYQLYDFQTWSWSEAFRSRDHDKWSVINFFRWSLIWDAADSVIVLKKLHAAKIMMWTIMMMTMTRVVMMIMITNQ